jgi:heme-degrading monooxygenase HmoA
VYVVHNRIVVPAEAAEKFEAAFVESMRSTLHGVPGLVRSALLRPASEGQPYLATVEFASHDDFVAWMRSDAFKAAHANGGEPGMHTPTAIESFTVVQEIRA